jgi:hypothetical protein
MAGSCRFGIGRQKVSSGGGSGCRVLDELWTKEAEFFFSFLEHDFTCLFIKQRSAKRAAYTKQLQAYP